MIIDNRYYRIKSIFGYRLRALMRTWSNSQESPPWAIIYCQYELSTAMQFKVLCNGNVGITMSEEAGCRARDQIVKRRNCHQYELSTEQHCIAIHFIATLHCYPFYCYIALLHCNIISGGCSRTPSNSQESSPWAIFVGAEPWAAEKWNTLCNSSNVICDIRDIDISSSVFGWTRLTPLYQKSKNNWN